MDKTRDVHKPQVDLFTVDLFFDPTPTEEDIPHKDTKR